VKQAEIPPRAGKFRLWLLSKPFAAFLTCSCLAGCGLDPFGAKQEVREVRTSTSEDITTFRKDLHRLQQDLTNLSAHFDRSSAAQEKEILALKSAVKALDSRVAESNAAILSEADKKIRELDAKRLADKNQLVTKINSIVDRINALSQRLSAPSSPSHTPTETVAQKGFYYTVEEGDSLWKIVRKFKEYGVSVQDLQQANNMSSSDSRIVTGQKLFIPVKK
jgi:LysM repeat protein